MLCLGIETSCDETALALVRDGRLVDAVMSSQADVHALFGGVVPEIASREHYRLIGPLFDHLLARNGVTPRDIATIAVARGPGLLGSLLVGVAFAKGLSLATGARLVGVNHLHAHLLAAGLEMPLRFPALGLLVSGGHTHIYRIESPTHFTLLGRTLDDAAGEAFDKVAKMLNLPYPGGRILDELGAQGTATPRQFPRPYTDNDNLDFSFSGLKTAAQLQIEARPSLRLSHEQAKRVAAGEEKPQELADFCASFNLAVADTLRIKVERALDREGQGSYQAVIVAGGVAANSLIRSTMRQVAVRRGLEPLLPGPSLCTDNGSMVAYTGWLLAQAGLHHPLSLEAIPRGRTIPDDYCRDAAMMDPPESGNHP